MTSDYTNFFYELQFVDKKREVIQNEMNQCILRGEDSITFLLFLMMSLQCVCFLNSFNKWEDICKFSLFICSELLEFLLQNSEGYRH